MRGMRRGCDCGERARVRGAGVQDEEVSESGCSTWRARPIRARTPPSERPSTSCNWCMYANTHAPPCTLTLALWQWPIFRLTKVTRKRPKKFRLLPISDRAPSLQRSHFRLATLLGLELCLFDKCELVIYFS